jgi:hypothetical protein
MDIEVKEMKNKGKMTKLKPKEEHLEFRTNDLH